MGQGIQQEREGTNCQAPPPRTRHSSPLFPGDCGLKQAILGTLKGELFVSNVSLSPACMGRRLMLPVRAGTQHSRAPGRHHALC